MDTWFIAEGFQLHCPYEIKAVSSLRIKHKFNAHTCCTLTVSMTEEQAETCMTEASFKDSLLVRKLDATGQEHWFSGGISKVDMTMEDGIPHVTLEALSRSYDMDIEPKSRSYQNKRTTYTEIIHNLVQGYSGGDAQNEATDPDAAIGELIVQYQETDWQFMKRLASRLGTVILPDVTMDAARVYFGVPDFSWGKAITPYQYEMLHDRDSYLSYQSQETGGDAVSEADWTTYRVRSNQYFKVGENVGFKHQLWVISESVTTYEKGTIQHEYLLVKRQALRRKSRFNQSIQGVALEGRVVKRANNMVKVHLDIDKQHDEQGNWWFPYSPEGNNIFHCMPDEGARIKVYFPSGIEKQAMAVNSSRGRGEEMKSRTVFQKPTTKVFHMPGEAKMELGEDGVLFEKNTVSLTLDKDSISLVGQEDIMLNASNGLELGTEPDPMQEAESSPTIEMIKMTAKKYIYLQANTKQYIGIDGDSVSIRSAKLDFQKVELSLAEMLNDDELEAMYLEMIMTEKDYSEFSEERGRELEQLGKRLKDREITQIEYTKYLERARTNEGIREDIASRVSKRIENEPYYKDKMRKTLKGYDPDKLAANYQKVYLSSGTEASDEDSSNEQREEARRSYAEAYKNYNDAMEKNYQAAEALKEAKADHKLATMNGASAVKKAENKKKSYLSQGMEKLAGYISDWQQSDAYLEGIVPLMPNYFSKQNQAAIYYSRYNFQKFVVDPQRAAAETGIMYGIIAVVTAIPTGGTSLYLLAAAELMVGVGQIWINAQKLNDLNHGIIDSNPSFLMMDQNTLDTMDLALSLINLSMLAKHGMLKAADKFKNSQKIIAFREATEKLGNKFDDINKAINPKNYSLEDVQVYAIPGGGSLGNGGKRLVRSGDEPLFHFSKGADEGPKKPYKDKSEGKGKREKEARERREREERERREREKREREKKEKEERERKEREKKEKEEREKKEREKKEKEEREKREREEEERRKREGAEGKKNKLTEPSLSKGGQVTDIELEMFNSKKKYPGIKREIETFKTLRAEGYDVKPLKENPKGGNTFGIKPDSNPDFIIEGEVFDCYAPQGEFSKNKIKEIQGKTKKQATRIILNLDDFNPSDIDILKQEILRKANPDGDLKYLQELLVIKDGKITRWFWKGD